VAVLLVDIGNTRIKWAYLDGGRIGRRQAAVHSAWSSATYARRLFDKAPAHLWVASVAAPEVNRALARAASRAGITATFVSVPRRGGGAWVTWSLGGSEWTASLPRWGLTGFSPPCRCAWSGLVLR